MSSLRPIQSISLDRRTVRSFSAYPFCLPAVRKLKKIEMHPKVTFLVGENGSGKSTLLEAIAVAMGFNAEGGSRNFAFGTRTSHSELHRHLRVQCDLRRLRDGYFFRAESFFNVATEIERLDEGGAGPPIINSYGGKSLHEQSHGESFLALMLHRFGGPGLYLLDEPEAALSPTRQLSVLVRLHDLAAAGSQFIIATHSPILMAYPEAWIYACSLDGLARVKYTETEHYQITRSFLMNTERMLRGLLEEGGTDGAEGDLFTAPRRRKGMKE